MFTPKFPAMHDTRNENELKHFVIIIVFICKSLVPSRSETHSKGLIKNKQQRIYMHAQTTMLWGGLGSATLCCCSAETISVRR